MMESNIYVFFIIFQLVICHVHTMAYVLQRQIWATAADTGGGSALAGALSVIAAINKIHCCLVYNVHVSRCDSIQFVC